MHLAELGHNVTVIERTQKPARKSIPIHYYSMFRQAWEKLENLKFILGAECTGISENGVSYTDSDGDAQTISGDSVILAAGLSPKTEAAYKFIDSADELYLAGDCLAAEGLQRANRTAFAAAMSL